MEMRKIPTAEEFQRDYSIEYYDEGGYQGIEEKEVSKMLIEFAKLHVKEALKVASKEAEYHTDGQEHIEKVWIDTYSILNSYPLENIR